MFHVLIAVVDAEIMLLGEPQVGSDVITYLLDSPRVIEFYAGKGRKKRTFAVIGYFEA